MSNPVEQKFGKKWKALVLVTAGMVVMLGVMVIAHYAGGA